MTSVSPQNQIPAQSNTNADSSAHKSTNSISGTTSFAAVPAPAARSYANATKKQASPPIVSGTASPPVVVGGSATTQHAKTSSISPVNGKNQILPAVPTVASPAIASSNGVVNGASGEHSRKASQTAWMPNGAGSGPARTNSIQFGSIGGSPAAVHSVPQQTLNTPNMANTIPPNPRVNSPQTSPSPIPQPAASGGRPPSGLQGQGNNVVFGSLGGDTEASVSTVPLLYHPRFIDD
jgi:translation initiation factor 4G